MHNLIFARSFLPLYEASFSAIAASVAIWDFVLVLLRNYMFQRAY